jgi:ABC-type Na+ efflux pump permease subunit
LGVGRGANNPIPQNIITTPTGKKGSQSPPRSATPIMIVVVMAMMMMMIILMMKIKSTQHSGQAKGWTNKKL